MLQCKILYLMEFGQIKYTWLVQIIPITFSHDSLSEQINLFILISSAFCSKLLLNVY